MLGISYAILVHVTGLFSRVIIGFLWAKAILDIVLLKKFYFLSYQLEFWVRSRRGFPPPLFKMEQNYKLNMLTYDGLGIIGDLGHLGLRP